MSPDQIFCLQMELMQLCALHCIAAEIHRQREESAERILHHRFDVICKEHSEVKRLNQVQKVSEAQIALVSWRGNMTSAEVAMKKRLLSRSISDAWQLTDPDGEYTRIIGILENWFDRARGIQNSRSQSIQPRRNDMNIVGPIEDGWPLEVEKMESRLNSSLRGLEHVGEVPDNTDFGKILLLFKKLLSNSLKQLSIVRFKQISWLLKPHGFKRAFDDMTPAETMISDGNGICRGICNVAS